MAPTHSQANIRITAEASGRVPVRQLGAICFLPPGGGGASNRGGGGVTHPTHCNMPHASCLKTNSEAPLQHSRNNHATVKPPGCWQGGPANLEGWSAAAMDLLMSCSQYAHLQSHHQIGAVLPQKSPLLILGVGPAWLHHLRALADTQGSPHDVITTVRNQKLVMDVHNTLCMFILSPLFLSPFHVQRVARELTIGTKNLSCLPITVEAAILNPQLSWDPGKV